MGRHLSHNPVRGGRFRCLEGGDGRDDSSVDNFLATTPTGRRVGPKGCCPFRGLLPPGDDRAASRDHRVGWSRAPPLPARPGRGRRPGAGLRAGRPRAADAGEHRRPRAGRARYLGEDRLAPRTGLRRRVLLRADVLDAGGRLGRLAGAGRVPGALLRAAGDRLALLSRLPWWPVWVALGWVAVETVRGGWPFGGLPWGRVSYAVADTPWAPGCRGWASTGVSLLLALTGTTLAWLLVRTPARRAGPRSPSPSWRRSTLLLPAWCPGTPGPTVGLTVAAVQGDVPGDGDNLARRPPAGHRQPRAGHDRPRRRRGARARAAARLRALARELDGGGPVPRRGDQRRHRAAPRTPSACRSWSAPCRTPAPTDVLNQGIVWNPGLGGGRPLHQAAPGALRRVHPVARHGLHAATSASSR